MKQRKPFIIIAFLVLVLVGCSGGSDDDGGTSGGSGTLSVCQQGAGVYNYSDGSRFEVKPNCEFIYTAPDGNYGHGKIISLNEAEQSFTADLRVDTGPNKGTCSTITATPTSFKQTNISQC